jgi:hypothetical protein
VLLREQAGHWRPFIAVARWESLWSHVKSLEHVEIHNGGALQRSRPSQGDCAAGKGIGPPPVSFFASIAPMSRPGNWRLPI